VYIVKYGKIYVLPVTAGLMYSDIQGVCGRVLKAGFSE
jgi:hypothetical protein